jgi:hypothetical protein
MARSTIVGADLTFLLPLLRRGSVQQVACFDANIFLKNRGIPPFFIKKHAKTTLFFEGNGPPCAQHTGIPWDRFLISRCA